MLARGSIERVGMPETGLEAPQDGSFGAWVADWPCKNLAGRAKILDFRTALRSDPKSDKSDYGKRPAGVRRRSAVRVDSRRSLFPLPRQVNAGKQSLRSWQHRNGPCTGNSA